MEIKMCIFGCGHYGKMLHDAVINSNVNMRSIFCDNDGSKYGNSENVVISPAEAVSKVVAKDIDAIIIPGASPYVSKMAMLSQLSALGLDSGSVCIANMSSILEGGEFEINCLRKLSEMCMDELIGYDKPLFAISYPEIAKKRLLLVGYRKFVDDIADFFNELDTRKCDDVTKLTSNDEMYVVCDFEKEKFIDKLNDYGLTHKKDFIWIEDLIQVLRESETYFTFAYHPNRPIVLLGDRILVELLARNNPNMPICARFEITDWHQDLISTIQTATGSSLSSPLFLLVTNEFIIPKDVMKKAGYNFGTDFYFYDANNAKLADMLSQTIKCMTFRNLKCDISYMPTMLLETGALRSCCNYMLKPLGSVFCNNIETIIVGPMAKVLQLSTVNKTYCFCSEKCLVVMQSPQRTECTVDNRSVFTMPALSEYSIGPAYLKACSIYCRSCRNKRVPSDSEPHKLVIHEELLNVIAKIKQIRQGSGELLMTEFGRKLLEMNPNNEIDLTTNGMLMNPQNIEWLLSLYSEIKLTFSIDGATKDTFEYLRRGAKWETVMSNLKYVGSLRYEGKINHLRIAVVVQRRNYKELEALVLLARSVNADIISFAPLINMGTFTDAEYIQADVYNTENPCHDEFIVLIATNPIFREKNVIFTGLNRLIEKHRNNQ